VKIQVLGIVVKHKAKPIYYFDKSKLDVSKDTTNFAKVIDYVKRGIIPEKDLVINEERHRYALK
jgi:hypothetical protein